MLYTRKVLVPVAMETLSLQGAISAYHTADMLNRLFPIEPIRVLAFLPVMVNRRLEITKNVTSLLDDAAQKFEVPILPSIRTDQEVVKSMRDRRTLLEAFPNSKALEDYRAALAALLPLYEDSHEQAAGTP
jgi:cellulose biosynthesis protein BcsQ